MDTAIAGLIGKYDGHKFIELTGAKTKTYAAKDEDEIDFVLMYHRSTLRRRG